VLIRRLVTTVAHSEIAPEQWLSNFVDRSVWCGPFDVERRST
jgi:hypothetical protein